LFEKIHQLAFNVRLTGSFDVSKTYPELSAYVYLAIYSTLATTVERAGFHHANVLVTY
jgi:hypothetical protein